MSDWLVIRGVPPWDGRYEIDMFAQPFTTREWGWIKRYSDYLPATLGAYWMTDPQFQKVLAAIALYRNGVIDAGDVESIVERIEDAPWGDTLTLEEGETDADPPPKRTDGRPSSDGADSPTTTETSDGTLTPIGDPSSDTSGSVPATSAS